FFGFHSKRKLCAISNWTFVSTTRRFLGSSFRFYLCLSFGHISISFSFSSFFVIFLSSCKERVNFCFFLTLLSLITRFYKHRLRNPSKRKAKGKLRNG